MSKARQDAAFYVNESQWEVVWEKEGHTRFVVRNGDMRLTLNGEVIRYTDQLESAGVRTDADAVGLEFDENPWFEVWDTEDLDFEMYLFDTLDEAIAVAQKINA